METNPSIPQKERLLYELSIYAAYHKRLQETFPRQQAAVPGCRPPNQRVAQRIPWHLGLAVKVDALGSKGYEAPAE